MILNNKAAKGKPKKNLVRDFNFSEWFQDYTAVGGAMEVDKANPYRMKLTTTQGAQARLINIPVEYGKTYSLSFKECTGLYRAYKGKQTHHDDTKWLNKAVDKAGITFTVDSTYDGFITLRFTAGSPGFYYFENFQVEEGSVPTEFEPYAVLNGESSLIPKNNLVKPFTRWQQTDPNAEIISNHEVLINPQSNYKGFRDDTIKLRLGATYAFSIDEITEGAVIFLATIEAGTIRYTTLNSAKKSTTFTISPNVTGMWMEVHGQTNRGLFTIKNPMLVEGSKVKPFEPYEERNKDFKLVPKKANKAVTKAPYKDYPFTFNRESIENLDGVQYGYNSPRFKDGGLFIEEGLTNTFANSDKVQELKTVNGYYGQVTYNHGLPKGGKVQETDDKYTVQFELKKIGTDSRPFVSLVVGAQPPKDSWSWRLFEYDFHEGIEIEDLEDGWQRYTKTFTIKGTKGEYLQTFIKFICEVRDVDIDSLIRNVQIEERDYSTSYTTGYRKHETAVAEVSLDKNAGSIETVFNYKDIASKSQYIFDSNPNRWILYKDAWDNQLYVYIDGEAVIQLDKSVLPEGKVKAAIVWGNGKASLSLNGVEVGTGTYIGTNTTVKRSVYLGSRYTGVEHLNNVIYSVEIKDRNGNITYKF